MSIKTGKIENFDDMAKIEPNAIVLDDAQFYEYVDLFPQTPEKNNKDKKHGVLFFRGIRVIKFSKVRSLVGH